MKHRQFTAVGLRLTLSISLFAITLLAGVLFYFVGGQLQNVAVDASHTVVDAQSSQTAIQTLQQIQRELQNNQDVAKQASSIVADSQSYQYQDQIVGDLNGYAAKSGITITNMDFSTSAASTTTGGSTSTEKSQQSATQAPAALTGVKTVSVSITMQNPISYSNFLKFLRSIEDNLTKMQVQKVSLSKGTTGGDDITSDILTIQVYVK
jgi:hypothetical protein